MIIVFLSLILSRHIFKEYQITVFIHSPGFVFFLCLDFYFVKAKRILRVRRSVPPFLRFFGLTISLDCSLFLFVVFIIDELLIFVNTFFEKFKNNFKVIC